MSVVSSGLFDAQPQVKNNAKPELGVTGKLVFYICTQGYWITFLLNQHVLF